MKWFSIIEVSHKPGVWFGKVRMSINRQVVKVLIKLAGAILHMAGIKRN